MRKLAFVLLSVLLTACVSNTYLAKKQYLLQAHAPLFHASKPVSASLTVEPTLASPPFDEVQFIYRLKHSRYTSDYYNIFMTEPNTQMTHALTQFLQASHLFKNVNSASMILGAHYQLKTQLTALYADYADDAHPKAVLDMQFILVNGNKILFHKQLAAHVALATKSTQALVTAWNKALTIVLTKFSLSLAHQFQLNLQNTAAQPRKQAAQAMENNFLRLHSATPKPKKAPTKKTNGSNPHGFLSLDN